MMLKLFFTLFTLLFLIFPCSIWGQHQDSAINSTSIIQNVEISSDNDFDYKKEFEQKRSTQKKIDHLLAKGNWTKIIIRDQAFNLSKGSNDYFNKIVIKRGSKPIRKLTKKLYSEIQKGNALKMHQDPLLLFGKDSVWFQKNAAQLWRQYSKKEKLKLKPYASQKALKIVQNYSIVKPIIKQIAMGTNPRKSNSSLMLDFSILSPEDTIHIQATSPFPYMMPWSIFAPKSQFTYAQVYSSKIASIMIKLLPTKGKSNRYRLTHRFFKHSIIDEIYHKLIKEKIDSKN